MLNKRPDYDVIGIFVLFSGHHSHVQDAAAEVDLRADEEPRGVGDADVHNDLAAEDCLNVVDVVDVIDHNNKNNEVQLLNQIHTF